jgi:hypothetical protein
MIFIYSYKLNTYESKFLSCLTKTQYHWQDNCTNKGCVLSLVEYGEIKYANNRKKRNMKITSKIREGDKSVKEKKE